MKAVICGAGIAGLALASQLDDRGWEVVLLEKAPGPRVQGYMMDFFGAGYDAAEAMGLLPRLEELGYHVPEASLLDTHGRRRAGVRLEQFARTQQGRLLSIMRPDLELALRENLSGSVDLRFATSLTEVSAWDDRVQLKLTDGSVLEADLLVGADGIHSTVRRLVFGEETRFLRYLGFHTAAYRFEDPRLRAALGDRFCLTDTAGRQMGFYGLREGKVAAFAVHRTADVTVPGDLPAALRREYGSLGWVVPRALAQCPPSAEVYYDIVAQIEMPAWSRGRVTLVGDAGYAVSLLAGQGASLGIAGAYVLAEQLAASSSIEDGLACYERLWRPVVEEKQGVARAGARWFLPDSRLQLGIRRIALKLARLPGIDRLVGTALGGKPTALIKELHAAAG